MKRLKTIAIVGGVALAAIGGILALTNPNQEAYEAFATQQLSAYLEDQVCQQEAQRLGLGESCRELLKSNQSKVRKLISEGTQQQNFVFFSVYTTDLSVPFPFAPAYHFETAGVLQQFHVYEARRK